MAENHEKNADSSQNTGEIFRLGAMNFVRNNYGINSFRNLSKGEHKKIAKTLSIKADVISKATDEFKILNFFPLLEKSKAVPLARLRTNKELILFSNKYDIYKLSVREIYKLIKKFRIEIENNPRIILNDLQHDLIIGSTLGDANIRQRNKNCMFRIGHSLKQKEYAKWKLEILKDFENSGMRLSQRIKNDKLLNVFEFDINTHYMFNFYRKLFYNFLGVKIISRKILDEITPRSLAIWICDDGSYCKGQNYIILCTNSYSFEEHKIMKQYFNEVWNLNPTIGFRDNKYYYLRFKLEDTEKLVKIIKPFIIESMRYKIGE